MGILFGVGGAIAGLLTSVLRVRRDWPDAPAGEVFVFPLVVVPAMALHACRP